MKKFLLTLSLGIVFLSVAPAQAYNHLSICKATLQGYRSDPDVDRYITRTSTYRFIGFSRQSWRWHGVVGTWALFEHENGDFRWHSARCWGGDYGPDSIS